MYGLDTEQHLLLIVMILINYRGSRGIPVLLNTSCFICVSSLNAVRRVAD
jgi:hypothetical protein